MNESVLIQKIINVGVMLQSNQLEYSGAHADAKAIIEEIKSQISEDMNELGNPCNEYVEGINMNCATCEFPKYKH